MRSIPNYGGYMASRVHADTLAEMKKSDLLVALGERITGSISQGFTFPAAPDPQMPLVHVWPDANEVGRVWRPDLGMACEPAAVVRALLARGAPANAAKRQAWVAKLQRNPQARDEAGMATNARRRQFLRRDRRDQQASDGRRDGHLRRRQFRHVRASLFADEAGADVPGLGGRRDGRRACRWASPPVCAGRAPR